LIDRLGSYLASRPRRAAMIVIALTISLVLVLAATLIVGLGVQPPFGPPYPSEDTPLSLTDY